MVPLNAQHEVSLLPGPLEGKDARLSEHRPSNNFGGTPEFLSYYWTFGGIESPGVSLIEFDLSGLPKCISVDSAKLSLFHSNNTGSAGQAGNNTCYLKRVIEPWDEDLVTWNNSPAVTEDERILLTTSTQSDQDYPNIDVTHHTQYWINNPDSNFGFMLDIIDKSLYNSMKFASSDNMDESIRPKLTIFYHIDSNSSDTFQITESTCVNSGYEVLVDTIVFNENNPQGSVVLSGVNNCNSVIVVDLTFHPIYQDTINVTSTQNSGYEIIINGTAYNEANPSGTEILTTRAGCDSVIVVDLTFKSLGLDTFIIECADIICVGNSDNHLVFRADHKHPNIFGDDWYANYQSWTMNEANIEIINFDTSARNILDFETLITINDLNQLERTGFDLSGSIQLTNGTEVQTVAIRWDFCCRLIAECQQKNLSIYIPTAFSPNNDNINDVFRPLFNPDINIHSYDLKIYNRWGQRIFESNELEIGWEGVQFDLPVPEGVFIWHITAFVEGCKNEFEKKVLNGEVLVVR